MFELKFLQETTVWPNKTPNHVYVLTDDKTKMVGYVPAGKNRVFTFKAPIRIDLRGRTFKVVKNTFNYVEPTDSATAAPKWEVLGSKGDRYTVTKEENGFTCSCTGFQFRGKCKHIDQVAQEQK